MNKAGRFSGPPSPVFSASAHDYQEHLLLYDKSELTDGTMGSRIFKPEKNLVFFLFMFFSGLKLPDHSAIPLLMKSFIFIHVDYLSSRCRQKDYMYLLFSLQIFM